MAPASIGPMTEAIWKLLEFHDTARASSASGTTCGTRASRAGRLIIIAAPLAASPRYIQFTLALSQAERASSSDPTHQSSCDNTMIQRRS